MTVRATGGRASELVQPGLIKEHGTITIRVAKDGRNVGILVELDDGSRRYFQCAPGRLGTVALLEVAP